MMIYYQPLGICYASIFLQYPVFTLGRHRRRRVLSLFQPSTVFPSVLPSFCLSRTKTLPLQFFRNINYRPEIKWGGALYREADRQSFFLLGGRVGKGCTVSWNGLLVKMAMLRQILRIPRNLHFWGVSLMSASQGCCRFHNLFLFTVAIHVESGPRSDREEDADKSHSSTADDVFPVQESGKNSETITCLCICRSVRINLHDMISEINDMIASFIPGKISD